MFDETVIQDERLFSLEQDTDAINAELDLIEDTLESEFLRCLGPVRTWRQRHRFWTL